MILVVKFIPFLFSLKETQYQFNPPTNMTNEYKWLQVENSDATAVLKQHAYVNHVCKVRYTGEKYNGNISLCKRSSVINEDELRIPIAELDSEPLDESVACKICLKKSKLVIL